VNFKNSILCQAAVVVLTMGMTLSAANAQQGVINTIVGGGPSNMAATNANLNQPTAIAFDAQGNYYVAATGGNQVFKVSPSGQLTLVAGNGIAGFFGDGGPAVSAEFSTIFGIAVDTANPANVYVADFSNCEIRVVNQSTGIITSLNTPQTCLGGDGGPASLAGFEPVALALNPLNNDIYVVDFAGSGISRIRKIAGGVPTGTVTTVAGGTLGECQGTAPFGDGGSATGANVAFCFQFSGVSAGIALDTSVSPPNILISDGGRCAVREVIGGKIFRIAGSYTLGCGFKDATVATNGQLNDPTQLQVQASGTTQTVTVADTFNGGVRKFTVTATVPTSGNILTTGAISTIAGMPTSGNGFGGDGGAATSALLSQPAGVAFNSSGDLFIGDTSNARVREVDHTTQNINTVAGYSLSNTTNGEVSFDNPVNNPNIPGLSVSLFNPVGVFVNPSTNNVFIAAPSENVVHELSSTAVVNTVAGNGVAGFAGDGNPGNDPGTELSSPQGVVQDSNGNTYISDTNNCVIRIVNPSGAINDFVGASGGVQNFCGYSGDGSAATAAQINSPQGLAIDSSNNLYIADTGNQVIRKVDASTGNISTIAGNNALCCGYSGDGGAATSAQLFTPVGVAVDAAGNVYIADQSNNRIRRVDGVTHVITTVAGNGAFAFSGDGIATQNSLRAPQGVASDVNGNIFISDTESQILRWIDPAGTMLTFAGNQGCTFFGGDGGSALLAGLCNPVGISIDASGNIFFADESDNRIREVNAFAGIGRSTGSLNFGLEGVGTPTVNAQEVILSAIGPTTINNITTSGDFSEFDDCPSTLAPGPGVDATCEIDVFFSPTASGQRSGLLTISDNGLLSQTQTVSLQGLGTALSFSGALAFGGDSIQNPVSKTVTLKNLGTAAVAIKSIKLTETTDYSFGSGTCPIGGGSLAGKGSCTIIVTFNPQSTGAKKGTLVVSSNDPASPLLLATTGTGTSFESFSPVSVTFATPQLVGTSSKATKVTFKYSGPGTLTLNSLTPSASFSVNTTGLTTSPCNLSGTTPVTSTTPCFFNVVFNPAASGAVGSYTGTVTASFSGDPKSVTTATLPLSGTATEVQLTPAALSFGNVPHSTTKSLSLKVTNKSTANALNFTSAPTITGTNASLFTITGNNCSTVAAGGASSCTITVQFAPTAIGTGFTANLTLTDDGGGSPQVIKLTGNGT
jgi:sugar lactone lactonase YvrE